MWRYLNRDIAASSSSTLIIDGLDCRPILILSRENTVSLIPSLFSCSSKSYADTVLRCHFPRWQQPAPHALDNTEAWRDSEAEEQKGL